MQTATKTAQPIYRFSHTERLFFHSKPDRETRNALRASGWRWDQRGMWYRNHSAMNQVKPRELSNLLAPIVDNAEQPTAASA